MSKYRLKFSKTERGQYISHLDLLRTFTRSITRAGLPVMYSQGFSPHQLITFSLPLSVGITSETEFVDIEFHDDTALDEIQERLNNTLPPDLKILNVSFPQKRAKDIISARYEICLTSERKLDTLKFQEFFNQSKVVVSKRTKRSITDVNIMDYIYEVETLNISENEASISIVLAAGNEKNIKPELVIHTMEKHILGEEFDSTSIHRTNIFCKNSKEIESFS